MAGPVDPLPPVRVILLPDKLIDQEMMCKHFSQQGYRLLTVLQPMIDNGTGDTIAATPVAYFVLKE